MTLSEYLELPQSGKITLFEIDAPLEFDFINESPGIWFTTLSPGSQLVEDDNGNFGYWGDRNAKYYNINTLSVDGELYSEVASYATMASTNKSWFYDTDTTKFYIHLDSFEPPEVFGIIALGSVIGFSLGVDRTVNNYFENVYYEPILEQVFSLTKKKDPLSTGTLQYPGGRVSFNNLPNPKTGIGYFDSFSERDLYGQPCRVILTFEGWAYADALIAYTGKIDDFSDDYGKFNLNVIDQREKLSRKLPVNVFDSTTFPSMDSDLIGTPIPVIWGPVIKAPTYKTSSGNWKFADTEFNSINATIIVYNEDGTVFSHGGTVTDGTFTGSNTDEDLTVTCNQDTNDNGLDIITDVMESYEGVDFNSSNFDTEEWALALPDIKVSGIWAGKGSRLTTNDIIEQICTDNNGIFEVLGNGKYTFVLEDLDKAPVREIFIDEQLIKPNRKYSSRNYLTSSIILHSLDLDKGEYQSHENIDYESQVFARYRNYKSSPGEGLVTALTNVADAITLSEKIMQNAKEIFPILTFRAKTQLAEFRVLDNIIFTYKRKNGHVIISRATWQVLGVSINLTKYEVSLTIKHIKATDSLISRMVLGETDTDMVLGETDTDMVLGIPYWTKGG